MNYHYANSANQPVGPIPFDELHALTREGTIGPDFVTLITVGLRLPILFLNCLFRDRNYYW
jgi:hypothetical protein